MEPTTGVEPVDLFLTKEALYRLSYVGSSCKAEPIVLSTEDAYRS